MSAEQDIREAESRLYAAMIANDGAALAELCSSELAYVHSTAVVESETEWLAGVKRGLYDYRTIKSRGVTLKISGDMGVQHGIVDMSVATDGGPVLLLHLQFVLIWVREAGQWRLMLRQTTRIAA